MKDKILVNQNEYIVIKLLGHGKGGYSYLVEKGSSVNSPVYPSKENFTL